MAQGLRDLSTLLSFRWLRRNGGSLVHKEEPTAPWKDQGPAFLPHSSSHGCAHGNRFIPLSAVRREIPRGGRAGGGAEIFTSAGEKALSGNTAGPDSPIVAGDIAQSSGLAGMVQAPPVHSADVFEGLDERAGGSRHGS
jgi:hypothetical protein